MSLNQSFIWAAGWQKGPYDKIWNFESDAYVKTSIHVETFLKILMIYHQRERNCTLLKWYSVKSRNIISKRHETVQRDYSNALVGILFCYAYDWLSLQNERIVLPWSLVSMVTPAFYEYGVLQ